MSLTDETTNVKNLKHKYVLVASEGARYTKFYYKSELAYSKKSLSH